MDGMSMPETTGKVSVAMGMQLQVAVSETATVMFQTHVDRDDVTERNRSIDIAHASAERFLHHYRVTKLESLIIEEMVRLDRARAQLVKDQQAYERDTAERAVKIGVIKEEAGQAHVSANRRGEPKLSDAAARNLRLITEAAEAARSAHENNIATVQGNIAMHQDNIAMFESEKRHIEALLAAAPNATDG